MATDTTAQLVDTTKTYYDSSDADNFYFAIWGGEDIHVGLYEGPDHPIKDASLKTVERMDSKLSLNKDSYVLDMGAGFGGAARYLVRKYGCRVACLNLSTTQNERNREMNKAAGLDDKIEVIDGNFEEVPFDANTFDVVWSEDSFLHTGKRTEVLKEAFRVLKHGGDFIFTDPMQADDANPAELAPIYNRIHLDDMGSFAFYKAAAKEIGFEEVAIEDHTQQLANHYDRVRHELKTRYEELCNVSSKAYCDRMIDGLGHWVEGGRAGRLAWGILHFRKPAL